ncbi:MAG: hypothetical protein ACRDBQ_18525 [Shewanella sp.]
MTSWNNEILKHKWLFPQTEPDQQGNTRKLTIEPNFFKDSQDCENLKFSYSFGKGEGVYYSLDPQLMSVFIDLLADALRSKEKVSFGIGNQPKNGGAQALSVGRDDNLVPFVALSGDVNGQRKTKKFYFPLPKGYSLLRNGQPVNDLEAAERMATAFIKRFHVFQEMMEASYKKREWNNAPTGGGRMGSGGYNNGGGNRNQSAPETTENFDDFI